MHHNLYQPLQQSKTSHGNQPNYTGTETATSEGLSVSKVLKTERYLVVDAYIVVVHSLRKTAEALIFVAAFANIDK